MTPDALPNDPIQAMREARMIALGVWASDHQDKCGCDDPDSAFCDHPVPFEHTETELKRALHA